MLNENKFEDFAISFTIENDKVSNVRCSKQIVFGPYLSAGIAAGYLFGQQIIDWYMKFI